MSLTPPAPTAPRRGIIAGGNFIVDTIIRVDRYPKEEMLANILDETPSNGGGPYNVLKDLAALGAPFPLDAIGLVGDDNNGRWILDDCKRHDISTTGLRCVADAPTAHTQVMTVQGTGRRTFFHHRGANRLLGRHHFDFNRCSAKLFYLGYLMLLDALDQSDDTGRSEASRVLEAAHQSGLTTVVDLVSVEHPDYRRTVVSAIPWIDHLIMNEVEAGRLLGLDLADDDRERLEAAARNILELGVRESAIIHSPAGGVVASRRDGTHAQSAVRLPTRDFRGSNGAGDAFASGYLFGLHEDWSIDRRLQLAVCAAAMSLTDATPSAGIRRFDDCLQLLALHGAREWSNSPASSTASPDISRSSPQRGHTL